MSGHKSLHRTPRIQPRRSETTGKNPQLCAAKRKQLLHDIEDGGGIQVFSLAQIRADRPDFYDNPAYVLKQVQNYIYQLKRLKDSEYLLRLSKFNVVATSRVSTFFSPTTEACAALPSPSPPSTPLLSVASPPESPTPIFESPFQTPSPRRPNYYTARMSSSSGHNALALRPIPTHHDEVEGML